MYLKTDQDEREMLDTIRHEITDFVQHFARVPRDEAAAIRAGHQIASLLMT